MFEPVAQLQEFGPLYGSQEDALALHTRPPDPHLRLEESDLKVVTRLEPPPAQRDDGKKGGVHMNSLEAQACKWPCNRRLWVRLTLLHTPAHQFPLRPQGRAGADRSTGIADLIQSMLSGPRPGRWACLG